MSGSVLRDLYESGSVDLPARHEQVRVRARLLRARLGDRSGSRVVDLGCGTGDNTLLLAESLPASEVVGLDWAERGLRGAHERGLATVTGRLDPAALPLADGSCDAAVLCEVIEHLVDTDRVLDEMRRVVRPGGAILVTTPNLAAWFNRVLLLGGRQPAFSEVSTRAIYGRPGENVVGHLRLFTPRALREFLLGAGFVEVELAGVPFHEVPRAARPLDRFLARWPGVAGGLVAVATRP